MGRDSMESYIVAFCVAKRPAGSAALLLWYTLRKLPKDAAGSVRRAQD